MSNVNIPTPFRHLYDEVNVFRRTLEKDNQERRTNARVTHAKLSELDRIKEEFKTSRDVFNQTRHNEETVIKTKEYIKHIESTIIFIANTLNSRLQQINKSLVGEQIPIRIVLQESIVSAPPVSQKSVNMVLDAAQFLNLCANSLKVPYDGDSDKLQTFIDSIELIKTYQTGHEALALSFIKTRLTGRARSYITNEDSIENVVIKLKSVIKPESIDLAKAKLIGLEKRNKSTEVYVKELELLAGKLKDAYLTDGVPENVAEKYSIAEAKQAMIKNAAPSAKILIKASRPQSIQELLADFIDANTDTESLQLNFFRNNRGNFNGFSRQRGNRGNFRGNSNYQRGNNQYRGNNSNNWQGNFSAYSSRNSNNSRQSYSNNNSRRGQRGNTYNVRCVQSGNDRGPQSSGQSLGDLTNQE